VTTGGRAPFAFIVEGRTLRDATHGLSVSVCQGPDYDMRVCLESTGPALPRVRYMQLWMDSGYHDRSYDGHVVSACLERVYGPCYPMADDEFYPLLERDFPGRVAELLDVLLPAIPPFYARCEGLSGDTPPLPPQLHACLMTRGRYTEHGEDSQPLADAPPWRPQARRQEGLLAKIAGKLGLR
jgi:hypothetical protein